MIIASIHPFPYFDHFFYFDSGGTILYYRVEIFLYNMTFFKIQSILKLLKLFSKYGNLETEKIW
jgi:hypothetical protein